MVLNNGIGTQLINQNPEKGFWFHVRHMKSNLMSSVCHVKLQFSALHVTQHAQHPQLGLTSVINRQYLIFILQLLNGWLFIICITARTIFCIYWNFLLWEPVILLGIKAFKLLAKMIINIEAKILLLFKRIAIHYIFKFRIWNEILGRIKFN